MSSYDPRFTQPVNELRDDAKVLRAEQRVDYLVRRPLMKNDPAERPPPRGALAVRALGVCRLAPVDVTLENLQYRHVSSS